MPKPIKVSEGRKITLPKELCERLGIEAGDYLVVEEQGGTVKISPLKGGEFEVSEGEG